MKPNAKVGILYLNTDFGQNFLAGFKAAIKGSSIQLIDAQPQQLQRSDRRHPAHQSEGQPAPIRC